MQSIIIDNSFINQRIKEMLSLQKRHQDFVNRQFVKRKQKKQKPRYEFINEVIDIVCNFYNFPRADLFHKRRFNSIVMKRQIIIWLLNYQKSYYFKWYDLGDIFGLNHATAIHSIKVINNYMDTDKNFSDEMNILKQRVNYLTK